MRTFDEVARLVEEARSRSTRSWVPGSEGLTRGIEQVREDFDASMIPPELGSIDVEPHIARVLGIEAGSRIVWFVTKLATHRVFVDDSAGLFGVAWGPMTLTDRYVDLGFRTGDPIDAYLT
jgi:hypothetical protein